MKLSFMPIPISISLNDVLVVALHRLSVFLLALLFTLLTLNLFLTNELRVQ